MEGTSVLPAFPFLVRSMHEDDIPNVMSIERRSFPSPWPEAAYRYELRFGANSEFYVLQPREEATTTSSWRDRLRGILRRQESLPILGYAGLRFRLDAIHVSTIAVHPDWRRQGLGAFLFLTVLWKAIRRGAQRVTLEVRTSNYAAQRLYTRMGFVRTGMRSAYYRDGEDAYLMELGPLNEAGVTKLWAMRRAAEERVVSQFESEVRDALAGD